MRLQLMHYRALRSIEQHLRCDDALDTLFALFTRLNQGEALPAHERLGALRNLRRNGAGERHGRQASR